jgi:hypothetical protein
MLFKGESCVSGHGLVIMALLDMDSLVTLSAFFRRSTVNRVIGTLELATSGYHRIISAEIYTSGTESAHENSGYPTCGLHHSGTTLSEQGRGAGGTHHSFVEV